LHELIPGAFPELAGHATSQPFRQSRSQPKSTLQLTLHRLVHWNEQLSPAGHVQSLGHVRVVDPLLAPVSGCSGEPSRATDASFAVEASGREMLPASTMLASLRPCSSSSEGASNVHAAKAHGARNSKRGTSKTLSLDLERTESISFLSRFGLTEATDRA
jgi:hypothetical protein